MSIGEGERSRAALEAGRLTSKAKFGVIEGHMHPSVGRFKINKMRNSLDVNGPPLGIKTIHIVAQSIAPTCNYGAFAKKVLERSLKGCNSSK